VAERARLQRGRAARLDDVQRHARFLREIAQAVEQILSDRLVAEIDAALRDALEIGLQRGVSRAGARRCGAGRERHEDSQGLDSGHVNKLATLAC